MDHYIDNKLAFLHIPKTGGTSVRDFLIQCYSAGKLAGKRERIKINHGRHDRLEEIKTAMDLDIFESLTILTTIRNPYATVSSLYFFSREMIQKQGPFAIMTELNIVMEVGFPEFVEWFEHGWPSVFDWLNVDGDVPENVELLRLETLEEDLEQVMNDELGLGIDTSKIPVLHKTGAGENYLKHFDNQEKLFEIIKRKEHWLFDRGFYV
jgi:hypothetical protein